MKILQKPYSISIWIQNGRLVLPRVGNLCKWTCDCESQHIMSVAMQMKTEEKVCFVCLCVYSQECLPQCLCLRGSHTSHGSQSCHNTHRQVWGLERVWAQILEHGLIEQILHSPSCNFLSLALSLLLNVSLSLLLPLYSVFPTVPSTEGLFVIQSRKCNWSQICPAFCLISSFLCSCRLPSPCVWPQTASVRHMGTSGAKTEIDLVMSWMSDFKYSSRWHFGLIWDKGQIDVFLRMPVRKDWFEGDRFLFYILLVVRWNVQIYTVVPVNYTS